MKGTKGLFMITNNRLSLNYWIKTVCLSSHKKHSKTCNWNVQVLSRLSPPLMSNIFKLRTGNHYNLRHVSESPRPIVNSVYNGTESIYLGPNKGFNAKKT